jgi:hypothetical protein
MTPDAVVTLGRFTTPHVLGMTYCLKMSWVDAGSISAKVVEFESDAWLADEFSIDDTVSERPSPFPARVLDADTAISMFIEVANPDPAITISLDATSNSRRKLDTAALAHAHSHFSFACAFRAFLRLR